MLARAAPVQRLSDRRQVIEAERRVGLQGLGECPVNPGPLAWEQIPQHRLAEQLMTERVISLAGYQYSGGDSGPQRGVEHLAVPSGHRGQQPVPDPGAPY